MNSYCIVAFFLLLIHLKNGNLGTVSSFSSAIWVNAETHEQSAFRMTDFSSCTVTTSVFAQFNTLMLCATNQNKIIDVKL